MTLLNPRILGQAENAHRALLDHLLDGSGLTYQRWVALSLVAATSQAREVDIVERLVSALKVNRHTVRGVMTDLETDGVVSQTAGELRLSDEGRSLYGRIRAAVDGAVADLYRDIPTGDLEIAGRILTQVTARANTKLEELNRARVKTAGTR